MAGPPDAMAQEARFLALLGRVESARVEDGRLVLSSAEGPLLAFERGPRVERG
jgi:heat shock protein HslJ